MATEKKVVRKTMTVRVSPEMHSKLKVATKFKNLTIQAVMATLAEEWVSQNYKEDMEEPEVSE